MKTACCILVVIFAFSFSAFAQTPRVYETRCALILKRTSILRGIRLEMSPADVSKVLGIPIKPKPKASLISLKKVGDRYEESDILKDGEYKNNLKEIMAGEESFLIQNNEKTSGNEKLENIKHIDLTFYKDRLFRVSILYDTKGIKWANGGEIAFILSEQLDLPKELWKTSDSSALISCEGISLHTVFIENATMTNLWDMKVSDSISRQAKEIFIEQEQERLKNEEQQKIVDLERKKKIFKP